MYNADLRKGNERICETISVISHWNNFANWGRGELGAEDLSVHGSDNDKENWNNLKENQ